MDWGNILYEVGRTLYVIVGWLINMVLVAYGFVVEKAGAPAGFLFLILMFAVIPFLLINQMISKWQQGLEGLQIGAAKLFVRLVVVGLLTFGIMFLVATA